MPLGMPNPLAMYGVLRAKDRWEVCIRRDGQRHRKAFMFSTLGSEEGALVVAQAWRDQIVATHPALSRREQAQRARADTKENLPGVFCRRDAGGRPVLWTAHTQCGPGKMLQKSFSVGRYGDSARDMAVREREKQLMQMRDVVFGLLDAKGRKLLEQHAVEPEAAAIEPLVWPMPSTGFILRSNTSGVSGVYLRMGRDGQPQAWTARTRAGKVVQHKIFLISKYGDARAKELAIVEREKQLKKAAKFAAGSEAPNADQN